jgi:hypothetical protein
MDRQLKQTAFFVADGPNRRHLGKRSPRHWFCIAVLLPCPTLCTRRISKQQNVAPGATRYPSAA